MLQSKVELTSCLFTTSLNGWAGGGQAAGGIKTKGNSAQPTIHFKYMIIVIGRSKIYKKGVSEMLP